MTGLTDEMRANGWIEHDGGPCPVPLDSKPGIMGRAGDITEPGQWLASFWSGPAHTDWWKHESDDQANDIIAYRPEPNHEA